MDTNDTKPAPLKVLDPKLFPVDSQGRTWAGSIPPGVDETSAPAAQEVAEAARPGESPPDTREDTDMADAEKKRPRFEVLAVKDFDALRAKARQPGEDDDEGSEDDAFRCVLVEHLAGGGVKELGFDCGEHEDNSFSRAYSWVPGALNRVDGERRAVLALVREAFDRGLLDRAAKGEDDPEAQLWVLVEGLP